VLPAIYPLCSHFTTANRTIRIEAGYVADNCDSRVWFASRPKPVLDPLDRTIR